MNTALRVVAVLVLDLSMTLIASHVLWETSGGRSVVDAPISVIVGIVFGTAAALSVRSVLAMRTSTYSTTPRSLAIERSAAIGHGMIIVGACAAWVVAPDYRAGWSLTHATVQLLTATALQLVLDVLTNRSPQPDGRGTRRLLGEHIKSVEVVRVLVIGSAVAALFATRSVHGWDPGILDLGILSTAAAAGLVPCGRFLRSKVRGRVPDAGSR